jgi:hypothetical protein
VVFVCFSSNKAFFNHPRQSSTSSIMVIYLFLKVLGHYPELLTLCLIQCFCERPIIQTGYHVCTDVHLG